ncbi:MAG: OmpA family protein [Acidobacteria bacterium]|nr:MAG: OmpA family protein [Acidobacteriota bacterium]
MKILRGAVLALGSFVLAGGILAAQEPDRAGCTDHPLFPTRMPDYRIVDCKVEDYGVFEFWTKNPRVKTPVEGKFTFIAYRFTGARGTEPSALAVVRNYENAIRKVGGTIQNSVPQWWVNAKIVKDGSEAWAQIEKGNGLIWLRIVEKKEMEQHVVADAAAFGNDLRTTGHVAVYGINFDTGKATITPESAQAIGEVAKLLKTEPGLKVHVVGHTDNVGSVESNLKLSQDRAAAVVQALVQQHAIPAARLRAHGCASFAPVASNDAEDGRAKNRRVEIVKQ